MYKQLEQIFIWFVKRKSDSFCKQKTDNYVEYLKYVNYHYYNLKFERGNPDILPGDFVGFYYECDNTTPSFSKGDGRSTYYVSYDTFISAGSKFSEEYEHISLVDKNNRIIKVYLH